uniref:Uncharacterized protein n=1 Tax=Chlorobium phaeobacteroides (strain BS1) TaxID=331678 RepID=B3EKX7_CHLPB
MVVFLDEFIYFFIENGNCQTLITAPVTLTFFSVIRSTPFFVSDLCGNTKP